MNLSQVHHLLLHHLLITLPIAEVTPSIPTMPNITHTSASGHSNNDDDDALPAVSVTLASTRVAVQTFITPIVVSVGLLGNILNIFVLVQPTMRTSTNVYLLSLAMADIVYLAFSFALTFVGCGRKGMSYAAYAFNTYGRTISDMAGNMAVWVTVIFTVERYVAVCHPMYGKVWCTVKRAKLLSLIAVILCVVNTMPGFFELEIVHTSDGPRCRYTTFATTPAYELGYTWWYTTIFAFLPVAFLLVFNSLLIRTLVRAARARERMLIGGAEVSRETYEMRSSRGRGRHGRDVREDNLSGEVSRPPRSVCKSVGYCLLCCRSRTGSSNVVNCCGKFQHSLNCGSDSQQTVTCCGNSQQYLNCCNLQQQQNLNYGSGLKQTLNCCYNFQEKFNRGSNLQQNLNCCGYSQQNFKCPDHSTQNLNCCTNTEKQLLGNTQKYQLEENESNHFSSHSSHVQQNSSTDSKGELNSKYVDHLPTEPAVKSSEYNQVKGSEVDRLPGNTTSNCFKTGEQNYRSGESEPATKHLKEGEREEVKKSEQNFSCENSKFTNTLLNGRGGGETRHGEQTCRCENSKPVSNHLKGQEEKEKAIQPERTFMCKLSTASKHFKEGGTEETEQLAEDDRCELYKFTIKPLKREEEESKYHHGCEVVITLNNMNGEMKSANSVSENESEELTQPFSHHTLDIPNYGTHRPHSPSRLSNTSVSGQSVVISSSGSMSLRGHERLSCSNRKLREQQRVTLMLTVIVLIFLCCQLPWTILYIYRAYYFSAHPESATGSDGMKIAGNVVNLLAQVNASGNFYLYSFFSRRFRRTLTRLCLFRKNQLSPPSAYV